MSIRDFDKSREFSAELSSGMIGDAKYRFRLSALCPTQGNLSVETSYADLDVFTDAPPVVKPPQLKIVRPEAGLATLIRTRIGCQILLISVRNQLWAGSQWIWQTWPDLGQSTQTCLCRFGIG